MGIYQTEVFVDGATCQKAGEFEFRASAIK